MHAEDIAEDFPVITIDSNALDAARMLAEHRLPGIVVTDSAGQPYAVLPASQVVRFIVPRYVQDDPVAGRGAQRLDGRPCRTRSWAVRRFVMCCPSTWSMCPRPTRMTRSSKWPPSWCGYRSPLIAVMKDGKLHGVITASRLLAAALAALSRR